MMTKSSPLQAAHSAQYNSATREAQALMVWKASINKTRAATMKRSTIDYHFDVDAPGGVAPSSRHRSWCCSMTAYPAGLCETRSIAVIGNSRAPGGGWNHIAPNQMTASFLDAPS